MSYDALMVFRPALESILFGYRISKDLALAEVWINKNVNQMEFREKFRSADYPLDMPFKDGIKDRIDMLNDSREHPNVNYAAKSVAIDQKEIRVHFYDHDWENGYIESFNGKLRDELLNGEIFDTIIEARVITEQWRNHYNRIRPHSALVYQPPAPEIFIPYQVASA
jgi:hypothetical protein